MISKHGVRFAWSCLTIGKASYFGAFKCRIHEREDDFIVKLVVRGALIEWGIESENMLLDIFS